MQAHLGTIMCKFGRDSSICLQEKAIFVKLQKCPYHVTFDLDVDLEHILDAGPSGDHRVQVWSRSSYLPARRSDLKVILKPPEIWDFQCTLIIAFITVLCTTVLRCNVESNQINTYVDVPQTGCSIYMRKENNIYSESSAI